MYNYYELVAVCNQIAEKLDFLTLYLQNTLTPILYILAFAFLLKIGFTCLRGYSH